MAGTFTLSIAMPQYSTANAGIPGANTGGAASSEAGDLAYLLDQVRQQVGSGAPSKPIVLNGVNVGTYSYGAGMANAGR